MTSFLRFLKLKSSIYNHRGNTLISVMISFGVMSIMSAAMMSMMTTQRKQLKYIEHKNDIMDLKNSLSLVLQSSTSCSENFLTASNPNYTINTTEKDIEKRNINLTQLKSGSGTSATVVVAPGKKLYSGLNIEKIELANLIDNGSNEWMGDIRVSFVKEPDTVSLKPLILTGYKFTIDPTSASTAKILDCKTSSSGNNGSIGGVLPGVLFEPDDKSNFIEGYFNLNGISYTGNDTFGLAPDAPTLAAEMQKKADDVCQKIYSNSIGLLTGGSCNISYTYCINDDNGGSSCNYSGVGPGGAFPGKINLRGSLVPYPTTRQSNCSNWFLSMSYALFNGQCYETGHHRVAGMSAKGEPLLVTDSAKDNAICITRKQTGRKIVSGDIFASSKITCKTK